MMTETLYFRHFLIDNAERAGRNPAERKKTMTSMSAEEKAKYLKYCQKQLRLCNKEGRASAAQVWQGRIIELKSK